MTKKWDSYIVMSVAVGMTVACGIWLYKPGQRELSKLLASTQAMRSQLARGSNTVNNISGVKADVRRANYLLLDYRTRITLTPDVGNFIEEVSNIASNLKLQNQIIIPQSPQAHGTIVTLPIEISFESAFDKIFEFLRSVENLPRAVRVVEFAVNRLQEENDSSNRERKLLKTELILNIFYEAG